MPKSLRLLFILLSFPVFSQTVSLRGKVIDDKTQLPLESATVYLTNVADSTVIDYTITDKTGNFLMKTRKVNKPVFIKVSFIGFQTFKKEEKSVMQDVDYGTFRLAESENKLGEVIIKSEAPPIRIKNDTLEFNASSFKVRPDANVETLLKQLPGVEIDSEGKITVNGKEVNQILVNGKPFFDKDGKIALQNLPSDIINKVQISDTKTKKEEATKTAASSNNASINLTIDEDKNKGLFGKFMAGYGTDSRFESSALLNYFKDKRKISVLASSNNINSTGFSMDEIFDNMGGGRNVSYYFNDDGSYGIGDLRFGGGKGIIRSNMIGANYADEWVKNLGTNGSYFYSGTDAKNTNRTTEVNLLPTGDITTQSHAVTESVGEVNNFSLDFQYKIGDKITIDVNPKLSLAKTKNHEDSALSSFDQNDQLLNDNMTHSASESDRSNLTNTINFNKAFKKQGRYFNIMLEDVNSHQDANALNQSSTHFYQSGDPDDIRDQTKKDRVTKDSYATELEYSEPIDSLSVKLGVYARWEKNASDTKTYDFNGVSQSYSDINAPLSLNYGSTMKLVTPKSGFSIAQKKLNFNLSVGTTITQLDYTGLYLGNATTLNKVYIFPYITSYGGYRFTKSKSLWLNYEYVAGFPTALQILPIENLTDPLNTYVGNPNIHIDDGHSINLNYNDYDYASHSGYGLYVGGQYYNTQIVSTTVFDASGKRTTSYGNVSGTYSSYYGFHWNKTIKKDAHTFKIGLGSNAEVDKSKGFTNGDEYKANVLQLTPRFSFTYQYGELLTINPTYNMTYSQTNYTNYLVNSASTVLHKINIETTSYWPKNWVFGNDFGYTYNSNIADGFKKDFYLWNSSLAYEFFGKKMSIKVKVYDLLNQNQSAVRTINPTTIRDEQNTVLKRYAMFSLTYKLEKFGGKKKEESRFFEE